MRRVDQALRRAARQQRNAATLYAPPATGTWGRDTTVESYPAEEPTLDSYPQERTDPGEQRSFEPPVADATEVPPARPPVPLRVAPPLREAAATQRVALDQPAVTRQHAVRPQRVITDDHIVTPAALDGCLVVTPHAPADLVAQFDRLAEALLRGQAERALKTVMVSSASTGEGRSLTAANLALTLSERYGKNVLLVDAETSQASIHQLFGLSNQSGLFEAFRSGRSATPVPVSRRLSVLPAGPLDGTEMDVLASQEMKAFLQQAVEAFDWIVLDTPAASVSPETHLLAWMVDGVLLVIKAAQTPQAVVRRTIAEIGAHRVLGLVLNQVARRQGMRSEAISLTGQA